MKRPNYQWGGSALFTVQNILFTLLALVAGTSFVIQKAVNSNLRLELGSAWWDGFVSYLGGTIVISSCMTTGIWYRIEELRLTKDEYLTFLQG